MSAGKYESIIDVAKRKIKIFSERRIRTLYTTIGNTKYTLTNIEFSHDKSILYFRCDDDILYQLINNYTIRSGNGLSVTINLSETGRYKQFSAKVPKTDEPEQLVSDFWNNLKSSNSGGRRKKSRAKKSRKNRRTRNLRH